MKHTDLLPALAPAAVTGAALLAEHLLLWQDGYRGPLWARYGRLLAYTLGHGTILAGFGWYALRTGQGRALGALLLLSATGGATVAAAWALRVPGLPDQIFAHLMEQTRLYQSALHLALGDRDPGRVVRHVAHTEVN